MLHTREELKSIGLVNKQRKEVNLIYRLYQNKSMGQKWEKSMLISKRKTFL